MSTTIPLRINPDGSITMLYTDDLPLHELGHLHVERASFVEFDEQRQGWVVTFPDGTFIPHVFKTRAEALRNERRWLEERL